MFKLYISLNCKKGCIFTRLYQTNNQFYNTKTICYIISNVTYVASRDSEWGTNMFPIAISVFHIATASGKVSLSVGS